MTFNQLHPPFNNLAIRRAVLGAIDQAEAISTIAGADRLLGTTGLACSAPGRRSRPMSGAKSRGAARLREGQACLGGGRVQRREDNRDGADRCPRAREPDANRRRAASARRDERRSAGDGFRQRGPSPGQPRPAGEGRLQHVLHADRPLFAEHPSVRASRDPRRRQGAHQRLGQQPEDRGVARGLAGNGRFGEQKRLCAELQKQLWEDVPFIPLGEYWQASAYRKDLTDVIPGCFTTFYGVRRA